MKFIYFVVLAVGMSGWTSARASFSVPSQLAPSTPLERAVKETYRRYFGELIERPAIYNAGP